MYSLLKWQRSGYKAHAIVVFFNSAMLSLLVDMQHGSRRLAHWQMSRLSMVVFIILEYNSRSYSLSEAGAMQHGISPVSPPVVDMWTRIHWLVFSEGGGGGGKKHVCSRPVNGPVDGSAVIKSFYIVPKFEMIWISGVKHICLQNPTGWSRTLSPSVLSIGMHSRRSFISTFSCQLKPATLVQPAKPQWDNFGILVCKFVGDGVVKCVRISEKIS